MSFLFIKRLATVPNSIFYSFIKNKNEIIAFGRRHYGTERVIKKITVNDTFDVIEDNDIFLEEMIPVVSNTRIKSIF